MVGLTRTLAKEWGPAFGVRANTIAFGFIATRLTAPREDGAFITAPDGTRVALGIPGGQIEGGRAGSSGGNGSAQGAEGAGGREGVS